MKAAVFSAVLPLALMLTGCQAQEVCKPGRPTSTPSGELSMTKCRNSQHYPVRYFVSVDGKKLLEDKALFEEESNKPRSIWVFSGNALAETGCPDRLYLIDLSIKPTKVIAFGVKKACNQFQWASWGDKRSVIALKNNVSFVYENGKITPPTSGKKLWNAIEPPHAGSGLLEADAVGFAEDVPLPKP